MTVANHMLTGALIGSVIHQPALALPLAFLSHFVLDTLPHFGFSSWEERTSHKKLLRIVLATDAVMLLAFLCAAASSSISSLAVACALVAVAPDLAWVYRFIIQERFGKLEPKKGNRLTEFHSGIQSREFPNGFIIEYIVFAGLLAIFLAVT